MSFLVMQILLCLLVAGILGAILGWYMRGGCSKILKDCEEEWEAKVCSLEEDWTAQLQHTNDDAKQTALENDSKEQASLKTQIQNDLDLTTSLDTQTHTSKNTSLENMTAAVLGGSEVKADLTDDKATNFHKKIHLSDEKIKLYKDYGVDLENGKDLEDDYDIQEIRDIRSSDAKVLNEMGIKTTKDLKKLDSDEKAIEHIAQTINLPTSEVLSWVSNADLLQLPGMSGEDAELIQTIGISSTKELSAVNIYSLHNAMEEFNERSPIVPEVASIDTLKLWTKIAKLLHGGA